MDVHSAPAVIPSQREQWRGVWGGISPSQPMGLGKRCELQPPYELGLGRISAANGFCALTLHVLFYCLL